MLVISSGGVSGLMKDGHESLLASEVISSFGEIVKTLNRHAVLAGRWDDAEPSLSMDQHLKTLLKVADSLLLLTESVAIWRKSDRLRWYSVTTLETLK